jgi:hypothetical protein
MQSCCCEIFLTFFLKFLIQNTKIIPNLATFSTGYGNLQFGVTPPKEKKNVVLDGKVSILKKISEKILTSICHGVPQELGIEKVGSVKIEKGKICQLIYSRARDVFLEVDAISPLF